MLKVEVINGLVEGKICRRGERSLIAGSFGLLGAPDSKALLILLSGLIVVNDLNFLLLW